MRKRNNKLNIYLNDDELKLLKENSSKFGLNQSDYIRNIIRQNFDFKNNSNIINNNILINELINISNSISPLKNQMRLMGYPALEDRLQDIQNSLNKLAYMIKDNAT